MGTSAFGSNPGGWTAWVQSGSNYMNVIHQGSSWAAPTVGRFISLSAYFAGYSGGCQALMNAWNGSDLSLYLSSAGLGVAQGSASAGGQGWQSASTGVKWIGGPYPASFQFGWGRDPAASHVFSTQPDGGHYWGDTNTGGYSVSSIAGSTQAPMGYDGSVGAMGTMQNTLIYVRRGGAWYVVLTRIQRAGGAMNTQLYPIYKKPGNTPIQRLGGFERADGRPLYVAMRRPRGWVSMNDAMADLRDPVFAVRMAGETDLEDYGVKVWDDRARDWLPGLLLMHHSITSEFGTDRREWDRREAARSRIVRAAA